MVDLLNTIPGMGKFFAMFPSLVKSRRPVVFLSRRPTGINSFPAGPFDQLHHGFPLLRVIHRCDISLRLVEQEVPVFFTTDRLVPILDFVRRGDLRAKFGDDLSVDLYSPGFDQFISLTP